MKNQEQAWLLQEKYKGVESAAFHADCARLAAGEPLAYLIGHVPFLDCTIHLDSHPLIPRPETEYWTEKAINEVNKFVIASEAWQSTIIDQDLDCHVSSAVAPLLRKDAVFNILDLCAGSGAIGVAVAKAISLAQVTFAELDPAHLPTIEKNLQNNTTIYSSVTYQIVTGDLFENISVDTKFDFILTNPPYIDAAANTIDANVALHEPNLALFGGVAGMEIIARIITEAPQYLSPTGQLWIEHEPAQSEAIATLARATGYTSAITHPDQYGVPRFSVLTMAQ